MRWHRPACVCFEQVAAHPPCAQPCGQLRSLTTSLRTTAELSTAPVDSCGRPACRGGRSAAPGWSDCERPSTVNSTAQLSPAALARPQPHPRRRPARTRPSSTAFHTTEEDDEIPRTPMSPRERPARIRARGEDPTSVETSSGVTPDQVPPRRGVHYCRAPPASAPFRARPSPRTGDLGVHEQARRPRAGRRWHREVPG